METNMAASAPTLQRRESELTRIKREQFEQAIVRAIRACPDKSYHEIAEFFGIWYTRVAQIATKYSVNRPRGRRFEKAE